jgi:hypothetical protein
MGAFPAMFELRNQVSVAQRVSKQLRSNLRRNSKERLVLQLRVELDLPHSQGLLPKSSLVKKLRISGLPCLL